jgi:hypothetical protein
MLWGEEGSVSLYDCSDSKSDRSCLVNGSMVVFYGGTPCSLAISSGSPSPAKMSDKIRNYLMDNYPALDCFYKYELKCGVINKIFDDNNPIIAVCTLRGPFNVNNIFSLMDKLPKR